MEVAMEGTLGDVPFLSLLWTLMRQRHTGLLEIVQGKVKKTVAFASGRPVAISSNALSESLPKLLESAGKLNPELSQQLRDRARQENKSFETLLVELNILKEADLPRLNLAVSQTRLVALLMTSEGDYTIRAQPVSAGPDLPVPAAILQQLKRKTGTESPVRALMARRREFPRRISPPPFPASAFGIQGEAAQLLEKLDGSRSVAELLTGAGLPAEEAASYLQLFFSAGLIDDARASTAGTSNATATITPAAPPVAPPVTPGMAVPLAPPVAPPAPTPVITPLPGRADTPPSSGVRSTGSVSLSPTLENRAPVAAPEPRSTPEATPKAAPAPFSIHDLIAEEVGEVEMPIQMMARKVEQNPLLDFSMSNFTPAQRELANKFKDDFVRMHKQNYFEMLGVDRNVKTADVRKAYFNLAKEYHTDKLVSLPEPVQKLGREMFNLIQTAYDTLTEQETRDKYIAATFYGKQDDEQAAIEEVQTVLQADQHYKTGIGLLNAGNIMGAHSAFTRARELYPKEPEYNACYGYTLFKLSYPNQAEKAEEGEKMIHDAIRQNQKLDRANLFLGRIYLSKDNPEQAAKYFVRALKINGSNIEAGRELTALKNRREQKETGLFSSLFSKKK
ncbi:MAG: DnaJ domain-containing protein [Myxococcota bacterium]